MPAFSIFFFKLVEFAFFAAAQFLLDGFDLFVEVILFLGALHLALDARLDGAVHVELFDFDVEHVGDAGEAVGGVENLEQLLLLFDRQLKIGRDGVSQFRGIFHAHGGDHGLVIQRLAQLYILLEESGDALHGGFESGIGLDRITGQADGGLHEAFGVDDLEDFAALNAFDQDFDVAVGELEALHDVDDGADLINLVGFGLVHAGVMLGGEENLFVRGQRLFEGAHAGFPPDDERSHHVREDDHVPDGHHGEFSGLEFFFGSGQVESQKKLLALSF